MKPRLLDLFCGAGGAAMGYHRAGFEVVGVDHAAQPNYPFPFVQMDALEALMFVRDRHEDWVDLPEPHVIHASPPCQAYSILRHAHPEAEYEDLIAPVRELLEQTGLPWVIENVPGSPTRHVVVLCGSMFGLGATGRQLRRHRNFETSFAVLSPPCRHEGEAIGVYGGGPFRRYDENGERRGQRGGYQGTVSEKSEAMGIDWMAASELNQAIPPVYTELIGHQLMQHIRARAA